jgi:EAL domain-containing protein (putative c-di-GMP-specific phosphodiesterase class I)
MHSMLVKQICQQVLLVVCQSVEQREQVRIVTQHDLRRLRMYFFSSFTLPGACYITT